MPIWSPSVDIIATYAAVVATGALALEIRRWFESGPRLRLSLMADAAIWNGHISNDRYFVLNVTNIGNLPTTITHMVLLDYENIFGYLTKRPKWQALVNEPQPQTGHGRIPHVIEPGKIWMGMAKFNNDVDLSKRRAKGYLFVGIIASHKSEVIKIRTSKPAKNV